MHDPCTVMATHTSTAQLGCATLKCDASHLLKFSSWSTGMTCLALRVTPIGGMTHLSCETEA
jgi:hypothetical protein